jgi:hypothetical protein
MADPALFLKEIEMLVLQQMDHVLGAAVGNDSRADWQWEEALDNCGDSRAQMLARATHRLEQGLVSGKLPADLGASLAGITELVRPALVHLELQFSEALRSDRGLARRVGLLGDFLRRLAALRAADPTATGDLLVDPLWEEETKPEFFFRTGN